MLSKFNTFDAYFEDTQEARVKIASESDIKTFCDGLVPDPAFMYLHVIAMGAGDFYGCNKNGDYFPEKSLIMYHHTFEESAKVFKEHNNKFNSPSYGKVVKSWYNPVMHRVELILAVDRAKAPDIVAKVERGEVPEVSMGARVPHDVCSICGNKAAKKNEYCEHIRKELKHVYPDGRQVYMLNLQPTFFDISFVFRRADKLGLMLKKVARAEGAPLDHVFDEPVEKTAEIDKQVPADAVVKVLNKGMFNVLPKLEEVEPDLPPALLDRIASRYTLKDILHSFLHSFVPLKPREVTRIIIVQNGMPLESYDDVLRGINLAQRNSMEYPGGEMQSEISHLLKPFMASRSSYGPHVMHRVLLLRNGHIGKYAGLNYNRPDFENRLARFDEHTYNNELNNYKYDYSSVPVLYNERQYQERRQQLEHRRLREPINPFAVALSLGAMYAAYRGISGLQNVINTATSPKAILGAGAATLATAAALHGSGREKSAGLLQSKAVTHFAAPFVGVHLASAHYRNKYMRGEELNGVETFIAENPDYLSLAAPFAIHMGTRKAQQLKSTMNKVKGAFDQGMKTAADIFSTNDVHEDSDEQLKKFADLADTLSQAALTGIIFKGRGASVAGSVAGASIDINMYNSLADELLPKPEVETDEPMTTE